MHKRSWLSSGDWEMILLLFMALLVYPYSTIGKGTSYDVISDVNSIDDPDIHRNVSELISSKGYPIENHIVHTDDGYILSVQRIPYGKLKKLTSKRKPVLLQHGLLQSSSDWVLNFPHQSLGFLLADFGYDVWLGNTRGGAYSRSHAYLDPSSRDFWNFSFDEISAHDLPALIDYILNITKEDNLIYIGHSQGTTIAFALLSENPLYNKKIKLFVALAPEVEVSHAKSAATYIAPYADYIEGAMNMLGAYEFLPNSPMMKFFTRNLCRANSSFICENIMFMLYGTDREQLNQTRLPVYAAHYPNGASFRNFKHFTQLLKSKKFQKYDYGEENWKYYNQITPPEYNVSKITTPIALFWGMNDALSDVEDISLLEKKLKSPVYSYCVPWKDFSHYDFVLAKDARHLVYDEIMSLMNKFKNNKSPFKKGYFHRQTCQ